MKPFDLEKAKAGAVVVDPTNNATGTFLVELKTPYDFKYLFLMTNFEGDQYVERVAEVGETSSGCAFLKMQAVKVTAWVNRYPGRRLSSCHMYESEEDARKNAMSGCLGQAKVEWEE